MNPQRNQVHSFFHSIGVSEDIFQMAQTRKQSMLKPQDKIDKRGKWPYFRYSHSKRYALKVNNKYENMDWLCSKNFDQQWPVAYVILTFSAGVDNKGRIDIIKTFLLESKAGFDLFFLKTEKYKDETCLNEPIGTIGPGIICSPHFQQLMKENQKSVVTYKDKNYLVLLQCRVKKQQIRVTKSENIWVINEAKDIRPYSIMLFNSANLSQIKSSANTYKSRAFLWSWYKRELQESQNSKIHKNIEESKNPLMIIDTLMSQNKEEVVYQFCDKILNQSNNGQQQTVYSRIMEKSFKQKAKNEDAESIVMLGLQKSAEQDGSQITFNKRSHVSTQISTKVHATGFMKESKMFVTPIAQLNISSAKSQSTFLHQLKSSISDLFKIDQLSIVIHQLTKGPKSQPISVEWSSKYQQKVLQNGNIIREKQMQVHRFFKKFKLSPQDFESLGNNEFQNHQGKVFWRGGWPYFQPSRGKRYGIKAKFQYDIDDKQQKWLGMDQKPGQWAVAYHGLKDPKQNLGRIFGQKILKPGERQSYSQVKVLNRTGEKVGNGVYCTPNLWDALCFTGNGVQIEKQNKEKKKYFLVFQCRVNPASIKVTENDDYWVINDPKDIRPYGVILLTEQNKKNYPDPDTQFKQKRFRWKNYEKIIIEKMSKLMKKQ